MCVCVGVGVFVYNKHAYMRACVCFGSLSLCSTFSERPTISFLDQMHQCFLDQMLFMTKFSYMTDCINPSLTICINAALRISMPIDTPALPTSFESRFNDH